MHWISLIQVAHAQGFGGIDQAVSGTGIPKTTDLAALIGKLLQTLLGFVGTLFLLLMVYAGFTYMTARGDSKKVDSAKQMITGAIIGLVIIASAYAITSFVLGAVTGSGAAPPSQSSSTSGTADATPIPQGSSSSTFNCTTRACTASDSGCDPGTQYVCSCTNLTNNLSASSVRPKTQSCP